ncbi:conserved hypothetical protein [Hyphomonas neptunium ATCC 15444]|uniref:PepSY-associated TM helix domain protein n=1 Tax=Hyphomonas neptunium (strain ATCC 15444) TaxID=228405 RepID=Q0C2Q7_HYPNA|nr:MULTISPECIES: hypothetical protein [Hyphomonas]ABI78414.1 conserved hypothetical protein [Hyphomonas neptunium ATCC 15444]
MKNDIKIKRPASARQLHRQIGWVAAFVAMAWAITGFLHPVMSWTAPRPAVQAPPNPGQIGTLPGHSLATMLTKAGQTGTHQVRLVTFGNRSYWFSSFPGEPRKGVVDALTGVAAPEVENDHAIALARHYAALPEADIRSVEIVDRFSTEYPEINRLLPVWRVAFDTPEGLAVYVDTGADRLAAVTDGRRRALLFVFQNVHTLKFLSFAEPLRVAVLAGLILSVIATSLIGATLLLKAKGRGLRKAHTLAAWVALPFILTFTLSGMLHLLVTMGPGKVLPPPGVFNVADLDTPRPGPGSLYGMTATAGPDGKPVWRIETAGGIAYQGQAAGYSDADRARAIAGAAADAEVSLVTRFGREYSFANKRLPVLKVAGANGPVFVDVREGLIAAAPEKTALQAAEGWSFDVLHKWELLRPIGTRNRDYLLMTTVAVIFLTAALGLAIQLWRRRKQPGG